jgi:hypothetical protein
MSKYIECVNETRVEVRYEFNVWIEVNEPIRGLKDAL